MTVGAGAFAEALVKAEVGVQWTRGEGWSGMASLGVQGRIGAGFSYEAREGGRWAICKMPSVFRRPLGWIGCCGYMR